MNVLDFTLGAISLAVGLIAQPYVMRVWYAFKNAISRKKTTKMNIDDVIDIVSNMEDDISYLQKQIDDNKTQINNLAEALSTRDKNRKSNIRRDVREYLAEIRDAK